MSSNIDLSFSSSSSAVLRIAHLSETNVIAWTARMKLSFMERGLWPIVNGDECRPVVVAVLKESSSSAASASSSAASASSAVSDWVRRDHQALAAIAQNISDADVTSVMMTTPDVTAAQMWSTVVKKYSATSLQAVLFLRRRFMDTKLHEGGSMKDHLTNMRDMAAKLQAAREPLKDRDLAVAILHSVPESYAPLIMAMESVEIDTLTTEFVSQRLLAEEQRRSNSASAMGGSSSRGGSRNNSSSGGESALFSRATGGGGSANSNHHHMSSRSGGHQQQQRAECTFCHRMGHMENKCWTKHGFPPGHRRHGEQQQQQRHHQYQHHHQPHHHHHHHQPHHANISWVAPRSLQHGEGCRCPTCVQCEAGMMMRPNDREPPPLSVSSWSATALVHSYDVVRGGGGGDGAVLSAVLLVETTSARCSRVVPRVDLLVW